MPRPARALRAAYATGALILLGTALTYAADGHWPQALAAAVLATLLAEGAIREGEYAHTREQLRHAREKQARRDARVRQSAGLADPLTHTWSDLYRTCCLPAWDTSGHTHDPANCTRTETP